MIKVANGNPLDPLPRPLNGRFARSCRLLRFRLSFVTLPENPVLEP